MATGRRSKNFGSLWKRPGHTPTPKHLRLENGLHSKLCSLSGLTGNAGHTQINSSLATSVDQNSRASKVPAGILTAQLMYFPPQTGFQSVSMCQFVPQTTV